MVLITRTGDFWSEMQRTLEACAHDRDIADLVGWSTVAGVRSTTLWSGALAPMVTRYGIRRPDWAWDEDLARWLIEEWRIALRADVVWHRTVAPLHNLVGPGEAIEIEDDLAIRPLTDEDREALWRGFGGAGNPSEISPTPGQLQAWTHAIDLRWAMPRRSPRSDEAAVQTVTDVVRALRLHHPGVTGTTILWTRLDPPDAPSDTSFEGDRLYAPHGRGLFMHPVRAHVGPGSAEEIRRLLAALRGGAGDKRLQLALRRFNAAYERYDHADSLVDLWIAFEALLVPERSELKFRASLRIARLVSGDADARQRAHLLARRSYDLRSKVVHGEEPPTDLPTALEDTRELAREVLRAWLLDPPSGGIEGLDRQFLA